MRVTVPDEILVNVFENVGTLIVLCIPLSNGKNQLPRRDLLHVVRVCRAWHGIGDPLLYRQLTFPVNPSPCCGASNLHKAELDDLSRMRVFAALLNEARASQIRRLLVTDVDESCLCANPPYETRSKVDFASLCFVTLTKLLHRASRLRSIRYWSRQPCRQVAD